MQRCCRQGCRQLHAGSLRSHENTRETRALPRSPLVGDNARRFRQMRHAVFLAVACHAEVEVWIAQFSRTAHCACVKWLGFASRTLRKALSSGGNLAAMAGIVNNFRSKKD